MKFKTNSFEETQEIAKDLAKKYKNSSGVFALMGDLGAGKTTFTQGFAKGLGITDKIISPTFILQRFHPINNSNKFLHHIDLYRLEENFQFEQLGLKELTEDKNNFVLIEWAEKIIDKLPKNTTIIRIKKISQDQREIEIN